MHQPIENQPDEPVVQLNFDQIEKAKKNFPMWFNKLFNLVRINGFANLGLYFQSISLEETEDIIRVFREMNEGAEESGKTAVLFTMIVLLSQGDGLLTSKRVLDKTNTVASMIIASYLHKTKRATALYHQFDIDYNESMYIANIIPPDPEVQIVS